MSLCTRGLRSVTLRFAALRCRSTRDSCASQRDQWNQQPVPRNVRGVGHLDQGCLGAGAGLHGHDCGTVAVVFHGILGVRGVARGLPGAEHVALRQLFLQGDLGAHRQLRQTGVGFASLDLEFLGFGLTVVLPFGNDGVFLLGIRGTSCGALHGLGDSYRAQLVVGVHQVCGNGCVLVGHGCGCHGGGVKLVEACAFHSCLCLVFGEGTYGTNRNVLDLDRGAGLHGQLAFLGHLVGLDALVANLEFLVLGEFLTGAGQRLAELDDALPLGVRIGCLNGLSTILDDGHIVKASGLQIGVGNARTGFGDLTGVAGRNLFAGLRPISRNALQFALDLRLAGGGAHVSEVEGLAGSNLIGVNQLLGDGEVAFILDVGVGDGHGRNRACGDGHGTTLSNGQGSAVNLGGFPILGHGTRCANRDVRGHNLTSAGHFQLLVGVLGESRTVLGAGVVEGELLGARHSDASGFQCLNDLEGAHSGGVLVGQGHQRVGDSHNQRLVLGNFTGSSLEEVAFPVEARQCSRVNLGEGAGGAQRNIGDSSLGAITLEGYFTGLHVLAVLGADIIHLEVLRGGIGLGEGIAAVLPHQLLGQLHGADLRLSGDLIGQGHAHVALVADGDNGGLTVVLDFHVAVGGGGSSELRVTIGELGIVGGQLLRQGHLGVLGQGHVTLDDVTVQRNLNVVVLVERGLRRLDVDVDGELRTILQLGGLGCRVVHLLHFEGATVNTGDGAATGLFAGNIPNQVLSGKAFDLGIIAHSGVHGRFLAIDRLRLVVHVIEPVGLPTPSRLLQSELLGQTIGGDVLGDL